jgi:carboxyl-terminal processing protease
VERLKDAEGYYKEILTYPFDFSKKDTFQVDYDKKPFARNENEMIALWQKQLKVSTLSRLYEKETFQEKLGINVGVGWNDVLFVN